MDGNTTVRRDRVSPVLEPNLRMPGHRLNEVIATLTCWAAIIATPTAVTGFCGRDVVHPGFQQKSGLNFSVVPIVVIAGGLFVGCKRKGWL